MQVIKHLPNHGELVELLPVFLVFQEEEPIELDKELLETCVEGVACLLQPRLIEDGTEK